MDTPRRWQVASLATAVASLGVGGMLIGRPAVDHVPAIDLDHITRSSVTTHGSDADPTVPGVPQIVEAEVVGVSDDPPATAETAASTASVASPEQPSGGASPGSRTTPPADPTEPDDSVDGPDSVDSDSSADS